MMHGETQALDGALCYRALRTRDPRFDGRFYTAVLSTRVYCRPVCPAPTPKRENVRFFPCAAAAQDAGFRPCRRCRPETAPGSSPWLGTTTTVSRALRLIAAGGLDAERVGALAARLGVGERHLRRLFLRHLGTTPRALAASRRLAFAKKLIDETRLPMSSVALAAGFQSVRRFNTAVRRAYARSPRELRRGSGVRSRAGNTDVTLRLAYRPPYDWEAMCRFLAPRLLPGVESLQEGVYRRSLRLPAVAPGASETQALVEVRHVPGEAHMLARIRLAEPAALMHVVERLRRLLDLDADPLEIASQLRRDPTLSQHLSRALGLRLPGAGDGFEAAVRGVLGQQIRVRAATLLAARLVEALGEPLRLDNAGMEEIQRLFPRPEDLAEADLAGMPAARAATLRTLARAVSGGRISFQPASLDEFVDSLCALPGIGPWTAHYAALRGLGEPDAFPAGDLGLRQALGSREHPVSPRAAERAAEAWRPWRAYAALILWNGGAPHANEKHRNRHPHRQAATRDAR